LNPGSSEKPTIPLPAGQFQDIYEHPERITGKPHLRMLVRYQGHRQFFDGQTQFFGQNKNFNVKCKPIYSRIRKYSLGTFGGKTFETALGVPDVDMQKDIYDDRKKPAGYFSYPSYPCLIP